MSILFFYTGKYPEGMAMSNRIHLYGKSLMAAGVDMAVVVPGNKTDLTKKFHEKVPYFTIKNPIVFRNYLLRQINGVWAAFIFGWQCYAFAKKYEIIFICGLGWFSVLMAIMGGHLGGSKVVMEVNENPYSPEGGRLDPVFIRKIRRWFMLHLSFRHLDGFIVISQKLKELVERFKKKSALVLRVPILIDSSSRIDPIKKNVATPYILHSGALSDTKDGMVAVFEAFARANKKLNGQLKFYLTQKQMHPVLGEKIDHIIKKYQLEESVFFTDYLPKRELACLRRGCSLAIVNKPSNWQNDYNFPTKLGEYLIDEIPVIASSSGEMCRYLEDMNTALLVPENDVEAMAEKIYFIIHHPEKASKIGEAGRDLAVNVFHYTNYSEMMKTFFIKVLN